MFESKPPFPRSGRRFSAAPQPQRFIDPKQRRMMVAALVLLLIALGLVLYHDRDFWFPDTDEAQDDQTPPTTTATTPSPTVTIARAAPAVRRKSRSLKTVAPTAPENTAQTKTKTMTQAVTKNLAPVPAESPVATLPPATMPTDPQDAAPPGATVISRTVLPPLEVEVVAGDAHHTVQPRNNSVRVDLQPDSPSEQTADASAVASAVDSTADSTVASPLSSPAKGNAEPSAGVTNAAERVQMSADTADVVSRPVNPGYPLLARQMKVQGSVILRALIGRDGLIQDLRVLSGPPILASAAEEAVKQWHFKPHYQGTEAVETQAKITVNFTISTN
jgi:periplasmic protein TonB